MMHRIFESHHENQMRYPKLVLVRSMAQIHTAAARRCKHSSAAHASHHLSVCTRTSVSYMEIESACMIND